MHTGRILGARYRLRDRVGGGGMGDVWRGFDQRLNRIVAIKVLHPALADSTRFRRRFLSEAHALAQLQAPGVVNLYDYGEEHTPHGDRLCYLVMEYVTGDSLADLIDEHGTLDCGTVMSVTAQAATALHRAHLADVIHRDVKPDNIVVGRDGQATLVDFGIAIAGGETGLTATGMIMGTVSYVSPEQLRNMDASPASDVYALGVVAYECLAGRRPFEGDSPAAIIAGHLHREPDPLPAGTPRSVSAILSRALAKDPSDRWRDAASFGRACRRAALEISTAEAAEPPDHRSGSPDVRAGASALSSLPILRSRRRGRHRKWRVSVGSAALSLLHRARPRTAPGPVNRPADLSAVP